jgi:hypothetical protein
MVEAVSQASELEKNFKFTFPVHYSGNEFCTCWNLGKEFLCKQILAENIQAAAAELFFICFSHTSF